MSIAAKQLVYLVICLFWFTTTTQAEKHTHASQPAPRVDHEIASLARDQIRAGHHKRFLQQQQESSLTDIPASFIFDYPPRQTQGQIKQIFWNEPEGLFALIDLGKQHQLLPGHLLRFYKHHSKATPEAGGAIVVLQTFQQRSYVMILKADLVPSVNDLVK